MNEYAYSPLSEIRFILIFMFTELQIQRQRRYRARLAAGKRVAPLEYDGRHISLLLEHECFPADTAARLASGEMDSADYDAAMARAFKKFFAKLIEERISS